MIDFTRDEFGAPAHPTKVPVVYVSAEKFKELEKMCTNYGKAMAYAIKKHEKNVKKNPEIL